MFIIITAKVDEAKTKRMRVNFDNVVSYGEAVSAPCMIMGLDGQTYPIMETPEQLDAILEAVGLTPAPKVNTIARKRR